MKIVPKYIAHIYILCIFDIPRPTPRTVAGRRRGWDIQPRKRGRE